jgi:aspartate-semialdehyde dehydrogenase
MSVRIGLVGATGALGRELLAALAEVAREGVLDIAPPVLLATPCSAGETFGWLEDDDELVVEAFTAESVRGLAYAIVAVPEAASAEVCATLARQGISVVDASRAHRARAPLFFDARPPGLGGVSLVALPSVEALLLSRVVHALQSFAPVWVRAELLAPASAAGQAGVGELAEATGRLLNGNEPETPKLPHRLAFNVIPQLGPFTGDRTQSELDASRELLLLTGREGLPSALTVGLGPWFYGHHANVTLGLGRPAVPDELRAALHAATRVKLLDTPGEHVYPMPSLATGDDAVLVGRLRVDPIDPCAVQIVAAMDGVRAAAVLATDALAALVRARESH